MTELRIVTANILLNFDVTFAEHEDGRAVREESRDCFTWTMGKLDVVLKLRKRRGSSGFAAKKL
jgi:cytochrome P450 family 628